MEESSCSTVVFRKIENRKEQHLAGMRKCIPAAGRELSRNSTRLLYRNPQVIHFTVQRRETDTESVGGFFLVEVVPS